MAARSSVTFAIAALIGTTVPLTAQVIEPPPRSEMTPAPETRAPRGRAAGGDRDRSGQSLGLLLTAMGGYDDNVSPEGAAAGGGPLSAQRSGTTGTGVSELRYRLWRGESEVTSNFRAHVNSFRGLGIRPLVGGEFEFGGSTRVGATSVRGTGQVDYRPTFAFEPAAATGIEVPPPTDPNGGVSELSSRSLSGIGSVDREWNARHSTSAAASYSRRNYTTEGYDNQNSAFELGHVWNPWRNLGLLPRYRLTRNRVDQATGDPLPMDSHDVSIGLEFRRPLSRTRRLVISGGPAATFVRTRSTTTNEPLEYTMPSGMFNAHLDLGRTWAVNGGWSRQATVLDGVTRQTLLADSISLGLGGNLTRSLTLAITGGRVDGAGVGDEAGAFTSSSATAQLQWQASDCCSVVAGYTFYQHRLHDLDDLPPGFLPVIDRNTVRIGMTLWLPVFGQVERTQRPTVPRN